MADSKCVEALLVQPLAYELLDVVRANMKHGPPSRENVFVAMNAVAIVAAAILCGTGDANGNRPSEYALKFFNDAVAVQIREMIGGNGGALNG